MKNELAKIRLGTSGYSYDDWIGVFYPEKLPRSQWLEFYSSVFNAVEINFTYYSLPNHHIFYQMKRKTPAGFEFIIKMFQGITHELTPDPAYIRQMKEAVRPLNEAGKMGGFLFQFPYRFKYSKQNLDYLRFLREQFAGFPAFIEFRHFSWQNQSVYEFLKEYHFHYVVVDEPLLRGLPSPSIVLIGSIGYFRFHGRNKEKWWNGKGSERYDYLYTEKELEEWWTEILKQLKATTKTFIFFNNHPQGKAVINARMIKQKMENEL